MPCNSPMHSSYVRPVVSLIIPVYNVERYLIECLESARRQSLDDIEVICINDGSTDGSGEILRRGSGEDERIRVIEKPNGGLSSARNRGMDAACGEFVMFLDSDDRLLPDACERVVRRFRETQADIVTFGAECFPQEGSERLVECLSPRDVVYRPFAEDLLFKEHSRPYVWRSAFKRDFLERHRLRFNEDLAFGEDQAFYFEAYPQADAVALMSDKLYAYRVERTGSLMDEVSLDAADRVEKHIAIAEKILSTWGENGWFERFGWQTLGWTLEFVILDLASLGEGDRLCLARRFGSAVEEALSRGGKTFDEMVDGIGLGPAARRMLRWVVVPDCVESPSRFALARFYLERRGLTSCLRRAASMIKRGR